MSIQQMLPHLGKHHLVQLYSIAQEGASAALEAGDFEAEQECGDVIEAVAVQLRALVGESAGNRLLQL